MNRPTLEVADIIRQHGKDFIESNRSRLTWQQLKVLRAIEHCRTAALGGHLDRCSRCGHRAISYNSAAIGTAQSASRALATAGWLTGKRNC